MAKPTKSKKPSTPVGVPQTSNKGPVFAVLAVVVALLLAVAVVVAQPWESGDDTDAASGAIEFQPVTVTGEPLPPAPTGGQPDPGEGQVAPTLEGLTFTGQPVNIGPGEQAKAVVFFAHWCPVCQREIPVVTDWLNDNAADFPVEYYAISTGVRAGQPEFPPSEWFADEGFPAPVMADSSQNTAADAYGLQSYPYMVFLDAENRVVARVSGELTSEQITEYVSRLVPAPPG